MLQTSIWQPVDWALRIACSLCHIENPEASQGFFNAVNLPRSNFRLFVPDVFKLAFNISQKNQVVASIRIRTTC
jgi:hypothetical protein